MHKRLLEILHCPISHKGLVVADGSRLAAINAAIEAGALSNRGGELQREPLKQALVTDDGKLAYPVQDGIPVLIESAALKLEKPA